MQEVTNILPTQINTITNMQQKSPTHYQSRAFVHLAELLNDISLDLDDYMVQVLVQVLVLEWGLHHRQLQPSLG